MYVTSWWGTTIIYICNPLVIYASLFIIFYVLRDIYIEKKISTTYQWDWDKMSKRDNLYSVVYTYICIHTFIG